MENRWPAVSVIIASHNYGHWIQDAVQSVMQTKYKGGLNILICDDGSNDNTMEVLRSNIEFLTPDKNVSTKHEEWWLGCLPNIPHDGLTYDGRAVVVRVLRNKVAQGPSAARNALITASWGVDIFAILDADDAFYPEKLEKLVPYFQSPEVGVVYADYDCVSPDGTLHREYKPPFSRQHLLRECIIHSGSLIRKEVFAQVGIFDEQLRVAEDYDLWLRATEKFVAIHHPEPLTRVRVGRHGSTHSVPSETWQACWRRVQEKTQERARAIS